MLRLQCLSVRACIEAVKIWVSNFLILFLGMSDRSRSPVPRSPNSKSMLTAAVLNELQRLPQGQRLNLQSLRTSIDKERSLASLTTLVTQMRQIGEISSLVNSDQQNSDVAIFVSQLISVVSDLKVIQDELDKQLRVTVMDIEKIAKTLVEAPDGYSWTRREVYSFWNLTAF